MVKNENNLGVVGVGRYPIPAFEEQTDGFLIPCKVELQVQESVKPMDFFKPIVQVTLDRPLYVLVDDEYVYCPTSMQWLDVNLVVEDSTLWDGKYVHFDVDSALFVHSKKRPTHFKDRNGQYVDVNNLPNVITDPDAPVVKFEVSAIFARDNSDPGTAPV